MFDQKAYEAWVKKVESELPAFITCPDCNGHGDGVCSHCGHDTDCETCDGDGTVRPAEILTRAFYMRVMAIEKSMLEHWIAGDGIKTYGKGAAATRTLNPLTELMEESQPEYRKPISKLLIHLPITEG